jgi:hypothetical protein
MSVMNKYKPVMNRVGSRPHENGKREDKAFWKLVGIYAQIRENRGYAARGKAALLTVRVKRGKH